MHYLSRPSLPTIIFSIFSLACAFVLGILLILHGRIPGDAIRIAATVVGILGLILMMSIIRDLYEEHENPCQPAQPAKCCPGPHVTAGPDFVAFGEGSRSEFGSLRVVFVDVERGEVVRTLQTPAKAK